MKNELSKEDQERIEAKAYKEWDKFSGYLPRDSDEAKSFVSIYVIGHTEGFNEAIEEVLNIINNTDQDDRYPPGYFSERLEKLKK